MRYKIYFLSLLTFSSALLPAEDILIEAKGAYYRPSDHKFRHIYSDSGIYGIEASYQAWNQLYAWSSVSCFYKSGHSIGQHHSTAITFVPFGIGLKYLFPINSVDLYVGAGLLGTYAHINNHSRYVSHSQHKWAPGGIVKVGALVNLTPRYFIDFFSDYSFIKMDFPKGDKRVIRHEADLSGWSVGLGVGYRFGGCAQPKKVKECTTTYFIEEEIQPQAASEVVEALPLLEDFDLSEDEKTKASDQVEIISGT